MNSNFEFRTADISDLNLTFQWANDPDARKNSFHTNQISFAEHKKWFSFALKDDHIKIYIFICNEKPVGVLRLNIRDQIAVISYSIDRSYRGLGYGRQMLVQMEILAREDPSLPPKFAAEVKPGNIASKRTFEALNYTKKIMDDHIEYTKTIV